MIRTPEPGKEKVSTSCQSFGCTRRPGHGRDWCHQGFVPEVRRKYLARKGLPFKVLLILDTKDGRPEPHELNTEGVKVVFLPPNTVSLIQLLDQGIVGP